MNEGEAFIRDAAAKRGITPDVAVAVANSEGGTDAPGLVGKFATGWSFWQFQLHYGGAGYEQFGTVAGMGNGFTALTGWQPGDPRAWRDSVRYALNRAKANGWGAWYGAAAAGISTWYGIDRSASWDANAEQWDYEIGVHPVPDPPAYNADAPPQRQVQSWTCSIRATAWILASLGLPFEIGALQDEMSPQYVTPADGLLDARGYGIAATLKAHLPPDWQDRVHVFETITWDELRSLAGIGPVALGLRGANHWINVARTRPDGDLDSPNPSPNYPATGPIGDTLSRAEFDKYGPASAVWVNAAATPIPVPPPVYAHPGDVGDGLLAMMASDKTAPAMPSTFLPLGRSPAMIEECQGLNGKIFRWHLPTGKAWVYDPAITRPD